MINWIVTIDIFCPVGDGKKTIQSESEYGSIIIILLIRKRAASTTLTIIILFGKKIRFELKNKENIKRIGTRVSQLNTNGEDI